MRWAEPEEFMELIVVPRMLLDHLPENIEKALATLLEQQRELPYYFDPWSQSKEKFLITNDKLYLRSCIFKQLIIKKM